jgi:hypothetical protein
MNKMQVLNLGTIELLVHNGIPLAERSPGVRIAQQDTKIAKSWDNARRILTKAMKGE